MSNSYPEGDPEQSGMEPSDSNPNGEPTEIESMGSDPAGDYPPAGPRYPQQLQYRPPADRDAAWKAIPAAGGPGRWQVAGSDQPWNGTVYDEIGLVTDGWPEDVGPNGLAPDASGTTGREPYGDPPNEIASDDDAPRGDAPDDSVTDDGAGDEIPVEDAANDHGAPVYPRPDQHDLWAGNPWGVRTGSRAPSGGVDGYGPPSDADQPTPANGNATAGLSGMPQDQQARYHPSYGSYGQPSGQQPFRQQAWESAASAASASATSAASAGDLPGSSERPRRNNNRLFLLSTGVLALALLAAAGVVGFVKWRGEQTGSGSAPVVTASDTVQGYLGALAAGNADRTIGYLAAKPRSTDLMTDAVLAASIKAAPISRIRVPAVTDPNARIVSASYQIGDQPVRTSFTVHKVEGGFVIDNGYLLIDVSKLPTGLPIELNGVRLRGDEIAVLPGTYQMSVPNKFLGLGDDAGFTVTGPQDVPAVAVAPELSDAGQRAFREAVSASVADCLKATDPTAGCGLSIPARMSDGRRIVGGTVRRQLSSDTKSELDHLTGLLLTSDPTEATATLSGGTVVTTATCQTEVKKPAKGKTNGKAASASPNKPASQPCDVSGSGTALATPMIDMGSTKLVVHWH